MPSILGRTLLRRDYASLVATPLQGASVPELDPENEFHWSMCVEGAKGSMYAVRPTVREELSKHS